ncbi:MAG: AMIN domain-containing protein, partial [Candidatus Aminicenantes bacterium]|nr:AMIN domain-containing protein [Candidatus Aminicenantes bacterium]
SAAAGPTAAPAAAPSDSATPRDASSIQKEIKKNPRDSSLYYGLYDLYRQKKDTPSAKQTLKKLLKNNPLEAKAYLLLGKLNYEEKEYGDASEALIKIFGFPSSISVEDTIRSEAAFYLALSSYLNKDKARALETHNLYVPLIQKFLSGGAPIADSDAAAWQNLRLMAEASPQVYLLAIRLEKTESSLEVKIVLSKPTTYRTFILTKERSIVIELFQMAGSKASGVVPVNARGLKAVRSTFVAKDVIRVTLEGQTQIPSHRIVKTDTGLSVVIE